VLIDKLMLFDDPTVRVLQDKYSVSFDVDLIMVSPLILAFLGDPLAALFCDMANIDPHWYLDSENFPGEENE
jgi:hypothetical protein